MNLKSTLSAVSLTLALAIGTTVHAQAQTSVTAAEAREIAEEAYIYGFPMVDDYRIQYAYFADSKNPEFKASWNQIVNVPRVSMPADTAIQTANSDTPYSFVGMDLRAEPIVLTVPPIDAEWSIYVGSTLIQDSVWRCAWQALAP